MSTLTPQNDHIRPIDQSVLELLRLNGGLTVHNLTDELGVTATAVRQRLERLVQLEFIERSKESVGRGRPVFRYQLTTMGARYAAASYADLASALWQEVVELADDDVRTAILNGVARRMGQSLLAQAKPSSGGNAEPLSDRMAATASELGRRKVPAAVNVDGDLPVLEVHACPYPELAGSDEKRELCEMEKEMLSQALGQDIELDRCRLDGHDCCQFRPADNAQKEPSISNH